MTAPAAGMLELLGPDASALGTLDPDELVARLYADRPDLQAMFAALKQTRSQKRVDDSSTRLRDRERLERLKIAYAELYARARDVADALGACVRCWGEDPDCERCGGGGAPGSRVPDPVAFQQYVVPALAAMRAARAAQPPAPAWGRVIGEDMNAVRDTRSHHQTSQGVA